MKLNLENLKLMEKAILSVYDKSMEKKRNSLYMDFEKEAIYYHDNHMVMKIKFDYELEFDSEVRKNIFIDLKKFLYLIKNTQDEITLSFENNVPVFKEGKNRYTIDHLVEDDIFEDIFSIKGEYESLRVNPDFVELIKESSLFTDTDDIHFNSSVFINDKLYCATNTRFYEAITTYNLETELYVHKKLSKVILNIPFGFTLKYDDKKILLFEKDVFSCVFNNYDIHTVIPKDSDKKVVLSNEYSLIVNRKELLGIVDFLNPFFSSDSKPCKISIVSENECEVSTVSSFDKIKKTLPIVKVDSELIGYEGEYNGLFIKTLLKEVLTTDNVEINFHVDKIGALFHNEGNNDKNIMLVKYA